MRNHDAADDPRASYRDDPADHLDGPHSREDVEETPEQMIRRLEHEAYRDASLKMVVFLHAAFNFVFEAKSQSEMNIRFHAVSAAIDHPALQGKPHIEIARALGTTRANFSKHVVTFERQNDLPPTLSQKSEAARAKYSEARKAQLNGN